MKMIITHGLPGSGKSTWAENLADTVRVNRDDLRTELFGADYHKNAPMGWAEKKVTEVQVARITEGLSAGKNVVSDDTNFAARSVRSLVDLAVNLGADVEHVYFDVEVDECIRRQSGRDRKVPSELIEKMALKGVRSDRKTVKRFHTNKDGFLYSK